MIRGMFGVAVGVGLFLALLYFGFNAMQAATFEYGSWMGVVYMVLCFLFSVALARAVSGRPRK